MGVKSFLDFLSRQHNWFSHFFFMALQAIKSQKIKSSSSHSGKQNKIGFPGKNSRSFPGDLPFVTSYPNVTLTRPVFSDLSSNRKREENQRKSSFVLSQSELLSFAGGRSLLATGDSCDLPSTLPRLPLD